MEILVTIASNLNARDLGNFRLVHSKFANAGTPLLPRNGISVLNTSACLKELQQLLQCHSIASSIRQLTFFYGEWPVCTRQQWETHPLLFGGNDRLNAAQPHAYNTSKADKAFADYLEFVTVEQSRRYCEDVNAIFEALRLLGNLQTVIISNMHTLHRCHNLKYRNLRKRIWMTPRIKRGVAPMVQAFLLALSSGFPNVNSLTINGAFRPADIYLGSSVSQFPSIQKLQINFFRIVQNTIQVFLQAFPNLLHLSMGFRGWGPSIPDIIGGLFWPCLKTLCLHDMWASEQEFFSIFEHHQNTLEYFRLSNPALTQGSWRSLFTRIRNLHAQGHVTADGELFGCRSQDTIYMDHSALALLTRFMQDHHAPWPFAD